MEVRKLLRLVTENLQLYHSIQSESLQGHGRISDQSPEPRQQVQHNGLVQRTIYQDVHSEKKIDQSKG